MRRALTILMCMIASQAFAEHIIEIGARGGIANWSGHHTYVSGRVGGQGAIDVNYIYHSPFIIGVKMGLSVQMHRAGYGRTDYEDRYYFNDLYGDDLLVRYKIGNLREMYTRWSVSIPLQLAIQKNGVNFYIGPRIVFPFAGSWTEVAENASLSVYYPRENNTVYESVPLAASRSFSELNSGTSKKIKPQIWGSAELSYDILLKEGRNKRSYLSVGIYADISFKRESIDSGTRESILMLSDMTKGFPLHRELTPIVGGNRQGQELVQNQLLYDVGIKIAYRFAITLDQGRCKVCRHEE